MLSELQVQQRWRELFRETGATNDALAQAERLLEQLPPESPLRHRLGVELDELRAIHAKRQTADH